MPRPKDIVVACLALTTALLAILTVRQQVEIDRLSTALRAGRPFASPLTIHTASRRQYPVAFPPPVEDAAVRRDAVFNEENPPSPLPFSAEDGVTRRTLRRTDAFVRLMENPDFVHAFNVQRHASLDTRFAPLFRELNLGPVALAALKNLLVERENVALDVVMVSESLADGPLSPDALRASMRAAQTQVEQAIHRSLGNERYAVYREYERTLAQRATVAQLEQRLSYTSTPLAPPQAEALVRILAAHAPSRPVEAAPVISVLVRAGVPEAVPILPTSAAAGRVTEDVLAQSQTVLAPEQLQALRDLQVEQQAAVKAAELIRQIAPAGGLPGNMMMQLLQ